MQNSGVWSVEEKGFVYVFISFLQKVNRFLFLDHVRTKMTCSYWQIFGVSAGILRPQHGKAHLPWVRQALWCLGLDRVWCVCWQSNGSRQADWLRDWAWQNQSRRITGAGPAQELPFAKHLPGSRHGVKDSVPVPFFILVVSISSWANGSSGYVKWL